MIWAELAWPDVASWSMPLRIVAVVIATVVGALAAGLLVQLLSKGVARVTAPRPAVNLVRVAGGIAAGLGAFLLLFGTGGGFGFGGGPGGGGDGKDKGGKDSKKDAKDSRDPSANPDVKKPDGTDTAKEMTELRVEILCNKVLSESDVKGKRFYRVTTADGAKLMKSDKELVQFIVDSKPRPSVVYLEDYEDSADNDRIRALSALRKLADDLKKSGELKKDPDDWVKPAPQPRESPKP